MGNDKEKDKELMDRILKGEKITKKDIGVDDTLDTLTVVNEGANIWNYELSESKKGKKESN